MGINNHRENHKIIFKDQRYRHFLEGDREEPNRHCQGAICRQLRQSLLDEALRPAVDRAVVADVLQDPLELVQVTLVPLPVLEDVGEPCPHPMGTARRARSAFLRGQREDSELHAPHELQHVLESFADVLDVGAPPHLHRLALDERKDRCWLDLVVVGHIVVFHLSRRYWLEALHVQLHDGRLSSAVQLREGRMSSAVQLRDGPDVICC